MIRLHWQRVGAVSEGMTSGYVPGSVVWVPWSIARPERQRRRRGRGSWLSRMFAPRRFGLYQRCLAIHVMTPSESEKVRR